MLGRDHDGRPDWVVMSAPNPAQRLYSIFESFAARASEQQMISTTWADVFGVADSEVELRLVIAAGLIADIGKAIEASGDELQKKMFAHFAPVWSSALIAPHSHMRQQPSQGHMLIDSGALAALGGAAGFLAVTGPDVYIPDPEQLAPLREQLRILLDELRSTTSIPSQLRNLFLSRLNDVLWTLDNLETAGGDGVAGAVDKLVGAIVLTDREPTTPTSFKLYLRRALTVAGLVWTAFRHGPETKHALESWGEILKELPSGN